MKLSEFKVGDRVIQKGFESLYRTIVFSGKQFFVLEDKRGNETLWSLDNDSWLPYTPPESYDLMAPALQISEGRVCPTGCWFSNEEEARKGTGRYFHSWPAVIDKETGMYRVPRRKDE